MNFYISDLHFGHNSAIRFDNRPFADTDEMDRCLVELWNGRVSDADDVYVIGDFAFRNEKPEEWYLSRLKGRKHLIIGNHDGKLLKNDKAMGYFLSVDKMLHVQDGESHLCLCHFPIADWNGRHKGHCHVYGHIHGRDNVAAAYMAQFDRAYNASACINNYTPVNLRELAENNARWKARMTGGLSDEDKDKDG